MAQANFKKLYPASEKELATLLTSDQWKDYSFLFTMAETSTVIPYHQLEQVWQQYAQACSEKKFHSPLAIINLNKFPKKIELLHPKNEMNQLEPLVKIEGAVSWVELQQELSSKGLTFPVMPTEVSASVLAGLATSCTGEHSFGFGPLRDWVVEIEWLDCLGQRHLATSSELLHFSGEEEYHQHVNRYAHFKNAPFPRLKMQTDLLIGTEGQLGIILSATLRTIPKTLREHFAISCPHWMSDEGRLLKVVRWVQQQRHRIVACELVDAKANELLDEKDRIFKTGDTIFLEVLHAESETIATELLEHFPELKEDELVSLPAARIHHFRLSVPRVLNERNARLGLLKKGTDVQVQVKNLELLLNFYKSFASSGVNYTLFGHVGDAHLHFNFLCSADEQEKCDELLKQFYFDLAQLQDPVSPFAEHGIGLLKQKFILPFLPAKVLDHWHQLKLQHDPHCRLFSLGPMTLGMSGRVLP